MNDGREWLRSGAWLTAERIRLIAAAVLVASALGFIFLVVTASGLVDIQGRPIGTDFSNVYAAGTYVLEGRSAAPFDLSLQYAREQHLFGAATPFYGWHYPPIFLFVAAALALMPYGFALAVWQAVTLGLYLFVVRAILGSADRAAAPQDGAGRPRRADWLLLSVAFPAVLINVGHGQNGFLTAALIGYALVTLDRAPILAGILFGCLAYKPQYGLMIPLVLGATGRWRCFAAAAATVLVLSVATTVAFGPHIWQAFLDSTRFTRRVALEQGDTGWYKIQSTFAWARMWGASIPVAYALQGGLDVGIAAALVRLWRSGASYPLKASALCCAAILATPYTFDYDMMVIAPAMAFMAVDGLDRGFGPYEKTALAALWLMPLAARSVAHALDVPLGVPAMLAMFMLLLQRSTIINVSPQALFGRFLPN